MHICFRFTPIINATGLYAWEVGISLCVKKIIFERFRGLKSTPTFRSSLIANTKDYPRLQSSVGGGKSFGSTYKVPYTSKVCYIVFVCYEAANVLH